MIDLTMLTACGSLTTSESTGLGRHRDRVDILGAGRAPATSARRPYSATTGLDVAKIGPAMDVGTAPPRRRCTAPTWPWRSGSGGRDLEEANDRGR